MYILVESSILETIKADYDILECENEKIKSENALLANKVKQLEKSVLALQDKLGINSSNSGLPTSMEIYKKERKNKPKSDRKIGAQTGHKYSGYNFKPADKIEEVDVEQTICACGGALELESYQRHQKIEIPPIKPEITEYRLARKKCNCCGRRYKAKLKDYKLLGPHAESVISTLTGCYNNSKREVQQILSQVFNLDISLGLISASEGRVATLLKAPYDKLHEEIEESSHLYLDETSHNQKGQRGWCWFLGNENISFMKLAKSRGKKVIKTVLPEYSGKVITDRYAVYNYFPEENRQVCLAHLRRDFKRFAHSGNSDVSALGKNLLENIDKVFALYRGYKSDKFDRLYMQRQVRKVDRKIYHYLHDIRQQKYSEQASKVAKNILKCLEMMWLFVDNENIPPTNNFAERQIKHHVKYRKNSYHTWSDRGDRFLERIKSVYSTAKLRGDNPFQVLHGYIAAPAS